MTLIKKMALGILFMLFIVFIGSFYITMNNEKNYFVKQLESNAQDTATSLGLSLSQPLLAHDKLSINTMVQAVFDSGYFSQIQVKDVNGNVIVTKKSLTSQTSYPAWFMRWLQLSFTEKTALVVNGWMQAGQVSVVSDPSYVYASIWQNAVEMAKIYCLFAVIALFLANLFIQVLLRPLKSVASQALAISEHEFPIETQIPKTYELKQVTLAMNQMVLRIKSIFEEQIQQTELLRKQVYQDQLTGLTNQRYFLQQLSVILDNEDEFIPGYILYIVIDDLDKFNQIHGYQRGDQLILLITRICNEFWVQPSIITISRINGSTFAVINQESNTDIFDNQCKEFEQLIKQAVCDVESCTVHMGACGYFSQQSVTNLLNTVDLSIKKAREKGVFYCQKDHDNYKFPRFITSKEIVDTLTKKHMKLYAQGVTNEKEYLHKEILVRIQENGKESLGAGLFMPLAEKEGIAYLIDLYVLDELIQNETDSEVHLAVNISSDTILNIKHREAYLLKLKQTPVKLLQRLSLEIGEALVVSSFSEVQLFVKYAQELGVKVGIDRVGVHFSPMSYLRDLHLNYIKLHGSLIQDVDENESKQFLIYYFNEMAKTMGIDVIATQVEHVSQWETIRHIHITWGQGRYLEPVIPLV